MSILFETDGIPAGLKWMHQIFSETNEIPSTAWVISIKSEPIPLEFYQIPENIKPSEKEDEEEGE